MKHYCMYSCVPLISELKNILVVNMSDAKGKINNFFLDVKISNWGQDVRAHDKVIATELGIMTRCMGP